MAELLTAAQMRTIEKAAIESGEVTGLELMERAGSGVVEAVFGEWPELAVTSHRAVVLCGPGNNGGDGFVVARLLKQWGWEVEVFLYGDPDKLPPDSRVNYQRWGLDVPQVDVPLPLAGADLIVDALFGTGLTRPLSGAAMRAANALAEAAWMGQRVVAVDAPSGLCMDSGRPLVPPEGDGVAAASVTVSFHNRKSGHFLAVGPDRCGKVVVCDIGLAGGARPRGSDVAQLVTKECTHFLTKAANEHKYTHGHALILSGPSGKGGAARLAARGALRIGAGLVTVGCPHDAVVENAARLDAIMLGEIGDGDALARVLGDGRINALCLGPGLGQDRARDLVPVALGASRIASDPGRAVLIDADALTAFSGDPATLFSMLHEHCVLTPHAGEFARLFPDLAEKLNAPATKGPAYSKADATREAAARAGCTVLFKGPDTVIAAPSGRCSISSAHYDRAAPWLATAGSGDVLAGFITGLLARGLAPMRAAEIAAWLHVESALSFGPGLIAEDLPEELPDVFCALELQAVAISSPSA